MVVFNARFRIYVNKNVVVTMKNREKIKRVDLPTTYDSQLLKAFIIRDRYSAYSTLKEQFSLIRGNVC